MKVTIFTFYVEILKVPTKVFKSLVFMTEYIINFTVKTILCTFYIIYGK